MLGGASTAEAATFTVSNTNDIGPGSLRDALTQANADQNPDQIVFASGLSGSITLASPLEDVVGPVDIAGPGANQITISGADARRILDIELAGPDTAASVSGLTLTDGAGEGGPGGAIYLGQGDLTLTQVVVSSSSAASGGGIFFNGFPGGNSLTVRGSTISGNVASSGNGGGIGSKIQLDYMPGALVASDMTVRNSTISGNAAPNGNGGGISAFTNATGQYMDPASAYLGVHLQR